MRMHWWPLCRPEVHYLYIFQIYTPPSNCQCKTGPKCGPIRCWNQPSGARHQRVTVRPYRHDGRAVDSGAITPLLRTTGSACCPWAQVNHYVLKVLLGVMNGDMIHDDTERDRCYVVLVLRSISIFPDFTALRASDLKAETRHRTIQGPTFSLRQTVRPQSLLVSVVSLSDSACGLCASLSKLYGIISTYLGALTVPRSGALTGSLPFAPTRYRLLKPHVSR